MRVAGSQPPTTPTPAAAERVRPHAAAFYAANSLVSDRFLLTTAFNLLFTRPIGPGRIRAEGRWISGKRRVYVAEASLIDSDGEEVGRGTGTFMRSQFPLSSLPGYAA